VTIAIKGTTAINGTIAINGIIATINAEGRELQATRYEQAMPLVIGDAVDCMG
jgi:hypothetical protein